MKSKEIESIMYVYIVLFKFRSTTKGKTWDYQLDLPLSLTIMIVTSHILEYVNKFISKRHSIEFIY